MQVVIKPYDMLTLIFYDAHSHNHITIAICLLCSQENLYDMPTIIFYDENNDNHVTPKICLLHSQDNLHDMLCISPSVKYLSDRKTDIGPSDICHACKPSCFKTVLPSVLQ